MKTAVYPESNTTFTVLQYQNKIIDYIIAQLAGQYITTIMANQ